MNIFVLTRSWVFACEPVIHRTLLVVWINLAPFNIRWACYGRWPEFLLKIVTTRALFKLKWMSYQSPCWRLQKSTKHKKCGAELKEFHSWIHCMMCSTEWCYAWWFDKLALLSNMPFGGEIMTDSLRRCLTIIQSEHFPLFWHWPYLIFKWGLTSMLSNFTYVCNQEWYT